MRRPGAPLVVKDKVIVGMAGGERGVSGFLDAYDSKTGKHVWRFNTIPQPGEPNFGTWAGDSWKTGGASTWNTGSYDPDTNTLFWGTSNPWPDYYDDFRAGDNLYSAAVLALDPDTGKLKWHYQFTPHDLHDWDATQNPVLVDTEFLGQTRKVLAWPNRNGFFYLIDRTNGKFLSATGIRQADVERRIRLREQRTAEWYRALIRRRKATTACGQVSTAVRTGCRTVTARSRNFSTCSRARNDGYTQKTKYSIRRPTRPPRPQAPNASPAGRIRRVTTLVVGINCGKRLPRFAPEES